MVPRCGRDTKPRAGWEMQSAEVGCGAVQGSPEVRPGRDETWPIVG